MTRHRRGLSAGMTSLGLMLVMLATVSTPALSQDARVAPWTQIADAHQRVLASALERRADTSPEDRAAARALVREGDRAYRRQDYARAFTAYANAYPNAPLAYAYVMAGDAHWRDVLQAHPSASAHATCPIDNRYFWHDLAQGLAQQQQVGLALADAPLRTSWWYLRARRTTDCLQGLARDAATQPADTCADLPRLRACLGPPLPPP